VTMRGETGPLQGLLTAQAFPVDREIALLDLKQAVIMEAMRWSLDGPGHCARASAPGCDARP
jgi:hypothetical protein